VEIATQRNSRPPIDVVPVVLGFNYEVYDALAYKSNNSVKGILPIGEHLLETALSRREKL